jgi:hypothetical protein
MDDAPLSPTGSIQFVGGVHAGQDISAIAQFGDDLIIAADEPTDKGRRNLIQFLKRDEGDVYRVSRNITLSEGGEMDIEDVACDGTFIYVIGSHSARRRLLKETSTAAKNRKRLARIDRDVSRDRLVRLRLDEHGGPSALASINLRKTLLRQKVLRPFAAIPSKENGIDIEGLAVRDGWLYAGFRGPVLRNNYVPVLRFRFDKDDADEELLFVRLGGLGIRAMTEVAGGFLLVAGPVGDGPGAYRLFFWDGRDGIPGRDVAACQPSVRQLARLALPRPEAKAEGITLTNETPDAWEVLVVYDNACHEGATRFVVPKAGA